MIKFNDFKLNEKFSSKKLEVLHGYLSKEKKLNGSGDFLRQLKNYIKVDEIQDDDIVDVPKDKVLKKPYTTYDYMILCFKNGNYVGHFNDTQYYTIQQSWRNRRGNGEIYSSRKQKVEDCDSFMAINMAELKIKYPVNDIRNTRRAATSDTTIPYEKGNGQKRTYKGPKSEMDFDIAKSNRERYYQTKLKRLDFSDLYQMCQDIIRMNYKKSMNLLEQAIEKNDRCYGLDVTMSTDTKMIQDVFSNLKDYYNTLKDKNDYHQDSKRLIEQLENQRTLLKKILKIEEEPQ